MELNRIKKFAEDWGYIDVKHLGNWKTWEVFDGILSPEDEGAVVGLPRFILANDETVKVSEFPQEYREIYAYFFPSEDEDEDEDEDEE